MMKFKFCEDQVLYLIPLDPWAKPQLRQRYGKCLSSMREQTQTKDINSFFLKKVKKKKKTEGHNDTQFPQNYS